MTLTTLENLVKIRPKKLAIKPEFICLVIPLENHDSTLSFTNSGFILGSTKINN